MAVTTGNEYDHIDFTKNNITTRHPLKDATARGMVEDIVKISDSDPQLADNKIWIKETPEAETVVPTYDDLCGIVAPDYEDLTFPVAAGQHCLHNGGYYVAPAAIATSEDWTAAHWQQVTVGSESNGKADKADTVLTSTLSCGRKANTTTGTNSVVFGNTLEASGDYSRAYGASSKATMTGAVADGSSNEATGNYARAIQDHTKASATCAIAEGSNTVASGSVSKASGWGTVANHLAQQAFGTFNVVDPSNAAYTAKGNYAEIVGNGTSDNARSNARTLDWNGNEVLAGDLTINKDGNNEKSVGGIAADVEDVKSAINVLEDCEIDGLWRVGVYVNGTWNPTGPSLNNNNKRIRPSNFVFVKSGDIIAITCGSYKHTVGIWRGTLESNTNVRYDSTWSTSDEKIKIDNDGFFIVAFASTPTEVVLDPKDFDGSISITSYAYKGINRLNSATYNVMVPLLRNGRINSPGNADAVTTEYIIPIGANTKSIIFEYTGDKTNVDAYNLRYMLFKNVTNGMTTTEAYSSSSSVKLDYEVSNDSRKSNSRVVIEMDDYKGYTHIAFELRKSNNGSYIPIRIVNEPNAFAIEQVEYSLHGLAETIDYTVPILRNGSIGNTNNANAVTSQYVIPIDKFSDYIEIKYTGATADNYTYGFIYSLFRGATDGMTTTEAHSDQTIIEDEVYDPTYNDAPKFVLDLQDFDNYYDHISIGILKKENGTLSPVRIANEQYVLSVKCGNYLSAIPTENDIVAHTVKQSRHTILNATATPLTLLHFSDIHGDQAALLRIMNFAKKNETIINDVICTGDIVSNSGGEIASWWNSKAMTCVGNHDSATYSAGSGYNWTGISMADRSAYYIDPFESEWNVTHEAGKSYYYKDYASAKVRLIVMDVMLYMSNDTATEASAQTSWLSGLLDSAISNGLHVLIAIHSPHGGAKSVSCSFTAYSQTTMPTNTDCDTPQSIIDLVNTAKNNGLKFIGYLCGHTHIDAVWDAENDKKQNMYCVTCANVASEAQWKLSDLYRGADADAYNLVTIDAGRNLIHIVRGGGADVNDHMRNRKGICFAYTSNNIQGEM